MTDRSDRKTSCWTCTWWQPGRCAGMDWGECRRSSPADGWPETRADDWCGDWDGVDVETAEERREEASRRGVKP